MKYWIYVGLNIEKMILYIRKTEKNKTAQLSGREKQINTYTYTYTI